MGLTDIVSEQSKVSIQRSRASSDPIVVISIVGRLPGQSDCFVDADRRINLLDKLDAEGYVVKTVGVTNIHNQDGVLTWAQINAQGKRVNPFLDYSREIQRKRPNYFIDRKMMYIGNMWLDDFVLTTKINGNLLWPRDLLAKHGDEIYVKPTFCCLEWAPYFLQLLGKCDEGTKYNASNLGEGGLVISDQNVCLLSESLEGVSLPDSVPRRFYMPCPPKASQRLLWQRMGIHIDLEINFVRSERGDYVVLVNEKYDDAFSKQISFVSRQLNASKIVIPETEYMLRAVNFLALPDGKVFVPEQSCIAGQLGDIMGKRNVLTYPVIPYLDYGTGGGLRCSSLVIE